MSIVAIFPNLPVAGFKLTSPQTPRYNCLAWAGGVDDVWWDPSPGYHWPPSVPRDGSIGSLIQVYELLGYEKCDNEAPEKGFEKVAVYADDGEYTHAARQLKNGKWTSKLGALEDIEHNALDGVSGEAYGQVFQVMRRAVLSDAARKK